MKWLNRLKTEKGLSSELPKPPKAHAQHEAWPTKPPEEPFDSFGSTDDRRYLENEPVALCPRPYVDGAGDLVIPFDSDPKYHWWTGGQSTEQTIKEITEANGSHDVHGSLHALTDAGACERGFSLASRGRNG